MWQRIQTLYLALATALLSSMYFCKFATIVGPEGSELNIMYWEKIPYLVLLTLCAAGNLFSLFAFKIRMPQMRVATASAILLLAFQCWIVVDFASLWNEMTFSVTALFPLVAAILDILAARSILLDEAMVQSSARLRASRRKR
ncbi:MAG: DUF4293 domain-containing protein [Rikenellaceae bacterium]|nr:DUF4293 domain-containing protein [Rikenellaceae bacterium]MDY3894288.1 DUF4293 family protein [Candidatus Cryptobacteroides sp.]